VRGDDRRWIGVLKVEKLSSLYNAEFNPIALSIDMLTTYIDF
jgi:hypothetical protein